MWRLISLFDRLSIQDHFCGAFFSPIGLIRLTLHLQCAIGYKRCAGTLNHFSRTKVMVIAELFMKSLSRANFLSPWSNLANRVSVVKRLAMTLNEGYMSRSYRTKQKFLFSEHICIYFPLSPISLILHINRAFEKRV